MQRFYTGQGAEGDFLQNHNKDKGIGCFCLIQQ
jgi:hypothetical protein